jgi:hypothetical protein
LLRQKFGSIGQAKRDILVALACSHSAVSKLKINFSVEYTIDSIWATENGVPEDYKLFSHRSCLVLEWNEQARIFVPSRESTATSDQVDGFFNDDTERFLCRYTNELETLIQRGDEIHLKWIKAVLKQYPKISAHDHLQHLLGTPET